MFKKKRTKLQMAQEEAEKVMGQTNEKISQLGEKAGPLYQRLDMLQEVFNLIRNIPSDERLVYEKTVKVSQEWKQQVDKIEADYQSAVVKDASAGIAGVGAGVAVAAMGPTAAMGVATTFGVASTGTAISTLSGAAATNAALAWLGGGALTAGGGGMAAGNALLALAGPVGWTLAGVALLSSGLLLVKNHTDRIRLENIYTLISKRDIKSYQLAIVELNERIQRMEDETGRLKKAYQTTLTFGLDYTKMTEQQQYELGSYVNLMNSAVQLLVNPILGLQPKYSMDDFLEYYRKKAPVEGEGVKAYVYKNKKLFLFLTNLLHGIPMDKKDDELLRKSLRKNKEFLKSIKVDKKDFDEDIMKYMHSALEYQKSSAKS